MYNTIYVFIIYINTLYTIGTHNNNIMRSQKNENNDSRYRKTNRNCSINLILFGINGAVNNVINRMSTPVPIYCIKNIYTFL